MPLEQCTDHPIKVIKETNGVKDQLYQTLTLVRGQATKYFSGIVPMVAIKDTLNVVSGKGKIQDQR